MVARPERYPQVAATPGANYAEPASGVQLGGWPYGNLFPSSDANWLFRQLTDWNRAHDAQRLASIDILASSAQRVSSGGLTITSGLGSGLTAEITAGGVYYGNGERIDLTLAPTVYAGGNALAFPAGTTRYVIARPQPPSGGSANGSSCGELAVSASDVVAGWTTIATVTTNGSDIVTATQYSGVVSRLTWAVEPDFAVGLRGSDADLSGGLQAATGAFAGDGGGGDTLNVTAQGGGAAINVYGSSGGAAIYLEHVGARPAIDVSRTGSGAGVAIATSGGDGLTVNTAGAGTGAAIDVSGGSGAGLTVAGSTAADAATITAGAGRYGLVVAGSATALYGATISGGSTYALYVAGGTGAGGVSCVGSGTSAGLRAQGGTTAGANGVEAYARNSTGRGLTAYTHTTATAGTQAAWLEGLDQAGGAEIVSANYYPVVFTPKVSSPTYGSIYARPQTTTPTSWGDGSLTYASSVFGEQGQWMHGCSADSAFRGIWSSLGGFGYGASYNATNSNANAAAYTVLTTATMSAGNAPKNTGTVRITVTMRVKTSTAAANGIDVRVRDTTAGGSPTVIDFVGTGAGTGSAGPGWYLQGSTTEYQTTISFQTSYTLPASGARTFSLEFKRQGAANTITAQGSITIDGVY